MERWCADCCGARAPEVIGYRLEANRPGPGGDRRERSAALDQRVRPMGAHHQKFAVVSGRGALDELAVIGGSDTARSRRDGNPPR